MKYIILICDGAADWPIEELGNKTIFEATDTPSLDFLATYGKMGLLQTVPKGVPPGSEYANMSILGYNPQKDLTGRGPLEALSARVPLSDTDIAFRCNLITIFQGIIIDYSSGHIPTEEATPLIEELQQELGGFGIDFFPGIQYRHILRLDGKKYSEELKLNPPHDYLNSPYEDFLPIPRPNAIEEGNASKTAELLCRLIKKSHPILINHPINRTRHQKGQKMATHIWPWGCGKKPRIKSFKQKYGLEGSVISAVDLIFGIGIAAGLEPIHVEGATGLPDTNYHGKITAALDELKRKDFVYLHIEAIDEMGHSGDPHKKSAALRDFDQKIVKPCIDAEPLYNNQIKICVLPDHPTPCKIRTHTNEPVPFVIYDSLNKPKNALQRHFSEKNGKDGELGLIESGEDFMNLFLSSSS
ncbi:MAG: 2,3-bisphosphoglycerate-independent phosphoglycerate mutase [Promethearchaeota archaeon]|nr:MAG: 2,3-bisphosphoglycerate-independent phosphoglycerate mutase [Candidatus Lokiarchaeota archaeon]